MIEFDAETKQGDFELAVRFSSNAPVTALFGPSGAGKTTALNLIAGLIKPTRGRLVVGDAVFFDTTTKVFLPAHKRRVGLVFQDGQLFPHLTVAQNLAFGGWFAPNGAVLTTRDAVVKSLGIAQLLDRRPARLSGGERQRVALARALLSAPSLLLMDEPLASLDRERKMEILQLIERVRDEFRVPIVYVSHSSAEVTRLATHVINLKDGRVTESGPPASILAGPLDELF